MISRTKRKNGHASVEQRFDALVGDFDNLKRDVGKLLHSVGRNAVDDITDSAGTAVRDAVRTRPLGALAVAASVGALVGALFLRE